MAALVNAYLLFHKLRQQSVLKLSNGWGMLLFQVAAASVCMAVVLAYINRPLAWWLASDMSGRSILLGGSIAAGAAVYFIVLLALGLRPSKLGLRSQS